MLNDIQATPSPEATFAENSVGEEARAKLKRVVDVLPEAAEYTTNATDVLLESSEMAVYVDKQWKPAQVWLLSNGILIANRKAKVALITQGVKQKVSFERFIPLNRCNLSDVKDTPDLQNCFKLKGLNGSVFLHSPDASIKETWYTAIDNRIKELTTSVREKPSKRVHLISLTDCLVVSLAETVGKAAKAAVHRRTGSICTSGAASKPSLESTFLDQQPELAPERMIVLQGNLNDLADLIYRTQYDIAVDQLDRRKFSKKKQIIFIFP